MKESDERRGCLPPPPPQEAPATRPRAQADPRPPPGRAGSGRRRLRDAGEAGIVTGPRLCFALLRRGELHGRVGGNRARCLHHVGRSLFGRNRQERFVVARGLGALGGRRARLARPQAREIEEVGKTTWTPAAQLRDRVPGRPMPPSSDRSDRTAAAGEDTRLQRQRGRSVRASSSARAPRRRRPDDLHERVQRRSWAVPLAARETSTRSPSTARTRHDAQHARQRRLGQVSLCCARIRRVCAAARSASAREASAPGRSWLSTSVLRVPASTPRRSTSACATATLRWVNSYPEEGVADRALHVEANERLVGPCPGQCRLRFENHGVPQPEIERLP